MRFKFQLWLEQLDAHTCIANSMYVMWPCRFCDTVLPEIQATVKSPSHTNMHRGIGLAYTIISVSYMAVAITGYWAFGFAVNPFVVYSFLGPHWAVTLALILAIVQIAGCYQVRSSA